MEHLNAISCYFAGAEGSCEPVALELRFAVFVEAGQYLGDDGPLEDHSDFPATVIPADKVMVVCGDCAECFGAIKIHGEDLAPILVAGYSR